MLGISFINMRRRHHTFPFSVFTFHFINTRRRHHTFPFSVFTFHFINTRRRHHTFPFSVFTFHFINTRRRHHTFQFSLFTFQLKKTLPEAEASSRVFFEYVANGYFFDQVPPPLSQVPSVTVYIFLPSVGVLRSAV